MPELASIGPLTGSLETVASSIAAGIVVFGFGRAVVDLAFRRTRHEGEATTLRDVCAGGILAGFVLAFDLGVRYFV